MPYYLFTILANKRYEFVRQIENPDIDAVCRQYKTKAEAHYGTHNLKSFSAVMLSKFDPKAIKFIKAQGKKDQWNDIFEKEIKLDTTTGKKAKQNENARPSLGERALKKDQNF
jgi:hypothetical protein